MLPERASMLRYTNVARLVIVYQLLVKQGRWPLLLWMEFFSDYKEYKKFKIIALDFY
jgi:hypothetical protein